MEIRRQSDDGKMQDYIAKTTANRDPSTSRGAQATIRGNAQQRKLRGLA